MKKILFGTVTLAILGTAALSPVALASPGLHGAESGRCLPTHVDTVDQWDCAEWTDSSGAWHHATESSWFGPDGTGSTFSFVGENTLLTCGNAEVNCTLTLTGEGEINSIVGDDFGIRVTGGSVDGGFLCGFVELGFDPNWIVADNSYEGPWTVGNYVSSEGTLFPFGGSTTGSIGNIDLAVPLLGISVPNGHMHDVVFSNNGTNNPSSFSFNGTIYEMDGMGGHTATDCTVVGELSYGDINAW
jgi:hypothetical protein